MSQEQEDIQRLIHQARRVAPDEQALARVWQRLQAPPPAGPDDGGAEVPDPEALANATQALAGKAATAASLKAIAAVVVVGAAVVGGRWLTRPEPSAPAAVVARPEAPREPAVIEAPSPETSTAIEASPPSEPSPTKQAGRRSGTAGSSGTAESGGVAGSSGDAASAEEGPGAERRLLEAAQAALQRGAPAAALASLDEHARRFARGLLADEREVLRVLVLCAEQRPDEAEAVAQALLRGGPGLFLPRLRGSCVGERLVPVQRPKSKGE
ncbi:hypothetical protein OV203_10860 [Nannocystis sp. ILAH1]|uniref:hypothetical protein n=1 Tax=unclassified Nannocystis TaxID=2627009 RepID=UPI00226ECE98|nr:MULTISPECIES: hypothetical protein [unclassified Nannocystis]MCY0987627.1 hypothetical protein [Nannocystis sp. ILAH1]MCY1070571.1 hypothetical protein [Nannocystis sp. RBIL2]